MPLEPLFIVGAGKVGCALALALQRGGVPLSGIWSRSAPSAERASALLGLSCAWGAFPARIARAETVLITVVDKSVNETAGALLDGGLLRSARTIFHCGGSRPAERALQNLLEHGGASAGYQLGTLHPLLAFSDPHTSSSAMKGAYFGIEGSREAKTVARTLIAAVGARAIELAAANMALYHCAAVMASNQAIGLWNAARELLAAAGVPLLSAENALLPLIRSTVENLAKEGIPGALTGPVRRGDRSVIEAHLAAIAQNCPAQLGLYQAATRATVEVARQLKGAEQAPLLELILAAVEPLNDK